MDISNEFQRTYITEAGSTTVFTGRGTLGNITIGTTTTDAVILRDIGDYSTIGDIQTGTTPITLQYNCEISGGLYFSSTTTPVVCTVTWRQ
jgi:hypothetical protein